MPNKILKNNENDGGYEELEWVPSKSNRVERLFSRAKLTLRPTRKSMLPIHLEAVNFLLMNKELWNAKTVSDIINKI